MSPRVSQYFCARPALTPDVTSSCMPWRLTTLDGLSVVAFAKLDTLLKYAIGLSDFWLSSGPTHLSPTQESCLRWWLEVVVQFLDLASQGEPSPATHAKDDVTLLPYFTHRD